MTSSQLPPFAQENTHPDQRVFRQQQPIQAAQIAHLPLRERLKLRMVFHLMDGQRSVGALKAQLQLRAQTIDTSVEYLLHLQAIEEISDLALGRA